jgi:hypothetical protein
MNLSGSPAGPNRRRDTDGVELTVVPWFAGPLIRIAAGLEASHDLRRRAGVPIDTSDPDVAALVAAYDEFWAVAPLDGPAITVAHTAMLETASLLRCVPPAGPAEIEYIRRRRRAITALTTADPVAFLASL